jgi:hypothetical protein
MPWLKYGDELCLDAAVPEMHVCSDLLRALIKAVPSHKEKRRNKV